MKKLMSAILAAAISLAALPMSVSAAGIDPSYDMDLNGKVNAADGMILLDYYAAIQKCGWNHSDEIFNYIAENGDLTGDGNITASDCSVFLTYLKDNNIRGDINNDGVVSPADAAMVLSYYTKAQTGTLEMEANSYEYFIEDEYNALFFGDLDNNDKVNLNDAIAIMDIYVDKQIKN